ncbi:uncharacterized protein KY384_003283 [Bacidia gigantensis]|uniref:uncharacterized protein n=1 Tax=Bacidia gigantensis TaxID=2732470 RepID=UPI001D04200E|nr:uncharacterized protein KY384_003283 [Bacidia gigantensis]KAG8531652.1 hypothetical protein KY384_003283 [Bacidia gigantensis]
MLALTAFVSVLIASFVPASGLSLFNSKQKVLDDPKASVPGKNPLQFCENNGNYSLVIQNVDLDPNPPESGHKLIIEAEGEFTEEVEAGAYISLVIKYGLITLIKTTADLCDQMKEVDEECPLKGTKTIRKEVDIPKEVPPVGACWVILEGG